MFYFKIRVVIKIKITLKFCVFLHLKVYFNEVFLNVLFTHLLCEIRRPTALLIFANNGVIKPTETLGIKTFYRCQLIVNFNSQSKYLRIFNCENRVPNSINVQYVLQTAMTVTYPLQVIQDVLHI